MRKHGVTATFLFSLGPDHTGRAIKRVFRPGFGGKVTLEPDLDAVEALAEDQASRWARIGGAGFLSDAEKRELLGLGKSNG